MPSAATVEAFIQRVEANDHVGAVLDFYTEAATMQENGAAPRVGREAHAEAERRVAARARSIRSRCVRPVLVQGDHVVIRWIFEFDWADGRRMRLEELAWQRWEGERIAEETFFYDPAQLQPPAGTHAPQQQPVRPVAAAEAQARQQQQDLQQQAQQR